VKRDHLLFVSRSTPFHRVGGMEHAAWDLSHALAVAGARVSLLTTAIPGKPAAFEHEGVAVRALTQTLPGRYSRAWWAASRRCFLSEFSASVDAVVSVSAGAFGLLSVRGRAPEAPFVFQAHGTSLRDLRSKLSLRRPWPLITSMRHLAALPRDLRAYRRFDAVVAAGAAVADELRRAPVSWFLPRERVTLIPNGIDTTHFSPRPEARGSYRERLGIPAGALLVVSSSRLHAQKGVAHSLRGFALYVAAEPGARYLILGDGPARGRLEREARRLGLGERVVFAGAVDRARLPEWLSAGSVFLCTTLHREVGMPLNILEALACGLPVIASRHLAERDGWGEAVRGVDPRRPEEIAAALHRPWAVRGTGSLLPQGYSLEECARRYGQLLTRLREGRARCPGKAE
jgi:glycosyltransferase involved in cell wall biosynthesis